MRCPCCPDSGGVEGSAFSRVPSATKKKSSVIRFCPRGGLPMLSIFQKKMTLRAFIPKHKQSIAHPEDFDVTRHTARQLQPTEVQAKEWLSFMVGIAGISQPRGVSLGFTAVRAARCTRPRLHHISHPGSRFNARSLGRTVSDAAEHVVSPRDLSDNVSFDFSTSSSWSKQALNS